LTVPPALPILSRDELNRATLARQLLLRRTPADVVEATAAVGGLQAQEPASPYIALWTRLEAFDADVMSRAFEDRRMVKAGLMRATLHAMPATDYLLLRPAVAPVFSGASRLMRGAQPDAPRLARLRAAIEALAATPRPNGELRDALAAMEGVTDPDALEALWWWVRRTTPLLQAPTGGPWSFGRRPLMVAPEAWLGQPFGSAQDGLELLVRRYLGALGPATVADLASWVKLARVTLRPPVAALDRAGELWHGRDGLGRELIDLVDAPRPGADVDVPPRLLPMWDGLLLGHADRSRVIDPEDRSRIVAANGDTYPTFLVDGRVAGLWWTRRSSAGTEIELEPFRPLRPADRAALEAEAAELARFLAPREPGAYATYHARRDRTRSRTALDSPETGTSD
jgi:hypothetical protein